MKTMKTRKKIWWLMALGVLMVLFLGGLVSAGSLYQHQNLELKLKVEGGLNLIAEGEGSKVDSVEAELSLYPQEDFRQKLLTWNSPGEVRGDKVIFRWEDKELGRKEYGFETRIKTENKRRKIKDKIPFPLEETTGYEPYLESTKTIDKDNPEIVMKAAELAEGEEDLFRVVFKLARWVEENVNYELDTLTAEASQKASWVLENRRGVCDEMTSLFIAMSRSLGIPARFVSGVSYTDSELFTENWLPHGWAEVYFPGHGWVGFDITFGEYGYVDVSHIKLRDGFDPQEASTKFEWLADKVGLEAEELKFRVEVKNKGEEEEEEIILREDILGEEVELESYNLVKGIIKNKEEHYLVTTLKLGVPKEIEIIGKEKKVILLEPGEEKEVFWIVRVSEELLENYRYEFPSVIYSEKNISVEKRFRAKKGGIFYSKEEVENLAIEDEEKRYSGKIGFNCSYGREIKEGEKKEVKCEVKNKGNVNLKGAELCLGGICKEVDLLINQKEELKITVEGKKVGWNKLVVSLRDEEIDKKISLDYVVLDEPKIVLEILGPEEVNYKEKFEVFIGVNKDSFASPKDLKVILKSGRFENIWEMEELKDEQDFLFEMDSEGLSKKNKFKVKIFWEDKFGKKYEEEKEIVVKVKGETFWERMVILFNGAFNWFG